VGDVTAFGAIALGVAISVVLPPLAQFVKSQFKPTAAAIDLRNYLALGAFSLIVALLALVAYRIGHPDGEINFYLAVAIGYTWEATVEKIAIS